MPATESQEMGDGLDAGYKEPGEKIWYKSRLQGASRWDMD